MGMTLLLTAMDTIDFRTSEKLYIFVCYCILKFENKIMFYLLLLLFLFI